MRTPAATAAPLGIHGAAAATDELATPRALGVAGAAAAALQGGQGPLVRHVEQPVAIHSEQPVAHLQARRGGRGVGCDVSNKHSAKEVVSAAHDAHAQLLL